VTEPEPKRFFVSLDGCEHQVSVGREGTPDSFHVRLNLDGKQQTRTVRVLKGSPAALLLVDGRVLRLAIDREHGEQRVNRGSDARRARLATNRAALGAGPSASAAGLLVAPMPGRVVAVAVQAGDVLEKGALLLVIEAMKMQNELFCSGAGRVEAVLVKAGDTVERGAPLIRIV
jgi:3-methylcrotonyl-CoA carboxylase alpha subunit